MSYPHSSDPLPTVILVTPPDQGDRRPARRKTPLSDGEIPWMKIAIGGSIAWMGVILVAGLYYFMQGDRQPIDDGGLPPVPAVKPVAQMPVAQMPMAPRPMPAAKGDEPLEQPAALPVNKDAFVDCDQIRVKVLFMKDPAEAFQRAQAEKKSVFIMHLSGNLEDKEFT